MNRHEIAGVLREIALLLEILEDNPFKTRAYINAARILEVMEEDLDTLVKEKRLPTIRGIGSTLAENIAALAETGKLPYYEDLKNRIPSGVLHMLQIPGLGPKKVKALYNELGITGLRELEYACKENRLADLPGFGEKTQANVLMGIEYMKNFQGQYYYAEVLEQALRLLESLKNHPFVSRISLAGELRRSNEVVRDIVLVAETSEPAAAVAFFCGLTPVRELLRKEEAQAAVRLENGVEARLYAVSPPEYPFTLYNYTGSEEHLEAVRRIAEEKNYSLTRKGLADADGHPAPCSTETEILQTLGLSYIPPELRENGGEIEAARRGALPKLVENKDIRGVLHVHTHYSDGDHSLEEMVVEALDRGFQYIGFSDHSQSAYYAGGLKKDAILRQREEIEKLRVLYPQITIFSGIESDIRADGSLDYSDDILEDFDFVIASVHSHFKMREEEMTERIIRAISHPAVTMLAHPTGRILLARPGYALDMGRVLEAARQYGVIMELNASPARLDLDWRYLRQARDMGLAISINPDAHRTAEIRDVFFGVAVARKGWLTREDVFNCREAAEVKAYLTERKSRRKK